MGDIKKIGTLRKQQVVINGQTCERAVRHVQRYDNLLPPFYTELGLVKLNGVEYAVRRRLDSIYDERYRTTAWEQVESVEPVVRKKAADALSDEGKQWLEEAVEWMLREQYRPYKKHTEYGGAYMTLSEVTPTELAANLFGNFSQWAMERGVGREAPEEIACAWFEWEWSQQKWGRLVRNAILRLEKAGKVGRLYATRKGREVNVFCHMKYLDD